MTYIVMSPCIGTRDTACVQVCPVECFYSKGSNAADFKDGGEFLVINPEECIDCGACVPECPVSAILPEEEVPEEEQEYIQINYKFFADKSPDELEEARMTA